MRHRVRSVQYHGDKGVKRLARTIAAFIELRGEAAAAQRRREIDALPFVMFNGRELRVIRCNGTTGNGPHDQNKEEALMWSLIDLRAYRCPFHA